jgi:hypothetical protein
VVRGGLATHASPLGIGGGGSLTTLEGSLKATPWDWGGSQAGHTPPLEEVHKPSPSQWKWLSQATPKGEIPHCWGVANDGVPPRSSFFSILVFLIFNKLFF